MLIGPRALKSQNSIEKIQPRMMVATFNETPSAIIIYTGCSLENLPGAMDNRDGWWVRVREIRAGGMTWGWWSLGLVICQKLGDPFISQKSQRSLCVSFCGTVSKLCMYHLYVRSNLNVLHQWITFPTQSVLVLHSFFANLLHSLIIWLIVSSLLPLFLL